jgi:hypothetical protein
MAQPLSGSAAKSAQGMNGPGVEQCDVDAVKKERSLRPARQTLSSTGGARQTI